MPLALRLRAALEDDAQVHCPEGVHGGDVHYAGATQHLRTLFGRGQTIVGVCASGILIRAVAPLLNDKQTEPPVIAVAEDGSSVVPLLGGHHGGNALARRLAASCSGHAAITTAGDLLLGVSLDEPPDGYILSSPPTAKRFMSALIAGEPVRIEGDAPWLSGLPQVPNAKLTIRITEREDSGDPDTLLIHPQVLTVGLGCERGTDPTELEELVDSVLRERKLSHHSVACFATVDLKEDEPAVLNLKKRPVRFFSAEELHAEAWRVRNPSHVVESEIGVPSVAEAAALAAAGADGCLIVEKTKSRRATCAIAQSPRAIVDFAGRGRGQLTIVGIGPGAASERTVKSVSVLKAATDWVGYGYYLDLVRDPA
jgi:cobalt-precorrin 5A hydrolase/precorrin-3B C17-methyltransferase